MLSKDEFKRYQKQILLDDIGINGQLKIKGSKVAVVGAGGLGCPVLQYLAAAGVGTIGIIDFDVVEMSNLHRQTLYTPDDVGKLKAEVALQKLSAQNPFITIRAHCQLLNEEHAAPLLSGYDIIVDGCDNFATRYSVNDACVKLNKPLVYGSILGYEGQLAVFNVKGSRNLRDIFPEPPAAEDVPNCSENGVLGSLPAIIGSMMAHETLQVILERSVLANTFLIYSSLNLSFTRLTY